MAPTLLPLLLCRRILVSVPGVACIYSKVIRLLTRLWLIRMQLLLRPMCGRNTHKGHAPGSVWFAASLSAVRTRARSTCVPSAKFDRARVWSSCRSKRRLVAHTEPPSNINK